jgi:hypothetical protein
MSYISLISNVPSFLDQPQIWLNWKFCNFHFFSHVTCHISLWLVAFLAFLIIICNLKKFPWGMNCYKYSKCMYNSDLNTELKILICWFIWSFRTNTSVPFFFFLLACLVYSFIWYCAYYFTTFCIDVMSFFSRTRRRAAHQYTKKKRWVKSMSFTCSIWRLVSEIFVGDMC